MKVSQILFIYLIYKKMKKLMMFLFLAFLPIALMAQTEIPVPGNVMDVLTNFTVWVSSFLTVTGLTIFLTSAVLKIFKVSGAGLRQVISWGLGAVIVIVMGLLHIGFAKELLWYGVVAYAIAVSLAANRLFDIELLKGVLALFKLTKPY